MTPPTASFTSGPQTSTLEPIHNIKKNLNSSTTNNDATLAPYKTYVPIKAGQEPVENYEGHYRFADIKEHHTSRAMTRRYYEDMMASAQSDVIVIGAGSVGLTCAYTLALERPDLKITILEAAVAPGGGCWVGGQLMSAQVIRKPAHTLLDKLGVAYDDEGSYVVVKHAALFTSTILSKLLALPNVKLYNAVCAEDLIVKKDADGKQRVTGLVTNYALVTAAHGLQSCMDPQTMSAPIICSFCGHDGPFGAFSVKRLATAGLIKLGEMGPMDMNESETLIVNNTREVFPGMIVGGMELSELDSHPRMGASFGGMLGSGIRAAKEASKLFNRLEVVDGEVIRERS